MYGAYHHITVMGKEDQPCDHKYDVTGLSVPCENNDKFAIDSMLPEVEVGDLLFIHDTGAHGFSMGYNYNGKELKSAEVLLKRTVALKSSAAQKPRRTTSLHWMEHRSRKDVWKQIRNNNKNPFQKPCGRWRFFLCMKGLFLSKFQKLFFEGKTIKDLHQRSFLQIFF